MFAKRISDKYPKITISLVFLFLFFIYITPAYSISIPKEIFQDDPNAPWHIVADEIHYDNKTDQYTAKNNVIISKNNKTLSADFIRFNYKTMKVFANGNVVMSAGEDLLTGSSMELDLKGEIGTIYNGTIYIKENNFYIKGSEIKKYDKNSYFLDKGTVTTCEGDSPAWKITGRSLDLTVEGYGKAKNVMLWAKHIPALYFPYIIFPAKQKRTTGLLSPQFGYSEKKGEEYIQPVYWPIEENSDSTFYFHHMGKRGEKLGLEYRYYLDEKSKGTLMFDYFDDANIDINSISSRLNRDRYWLRLKHDQLLPSGFYGRIDLDIVSDQNYMTEFKEGYTGFDVSNTYFINNFKRGLDDYTDNLRVNNLKINRIWNLYNLNADIKWYDNAANRNNNINMDETLHKLPYIEFSASKQPLLNSSFYYDLYSEYTNFYRKDGQKGHRIYLYPRLYKPFRLFNVIFFEPSLGVSETGWLTQNNEDKITDKQVYDRQLYDLGIDSYFEVSKIFDVKIKNIDKIKNTIKPQLIYKYTPNYVQDNYPLFDSMIKNKDQSSSIDRIPAKNLLTYPITITFTSRSKTSPYTYNQFCRIKVEQSYDLNEAREDNPIYWSSKKERRPFSPFSGELDLNFDEFISFKADCKWSPYDYDYQSHNFSINLKNNSGNSIFIEHRYEKFYKESIFFNLFYHFTDKLSCYGSYEHNILDGKDIKKSLGFLYQAQCWSIDTKYIDEADDRKYEFLINLYGIGGFDQSIEGMTLEKTLLKKY